MQLVTTSGLFVLRRLIIRLIVGVVAYDCTLLILYKRAWQCYKHLRQQVTSEMDASLVRYFVGGRDANPVFSPLHP